MRGAVDSFCKKKKQSHYFLKHNKHSKNSIDDNWYLRPNTVLDYIPFYREFRILPSYVMMTSVKERMLLSVKYFEMNNKITSGFGFPMISII